MTFVTAGLAVAGLIAVAIPIIIHLLARQRRKPIEWAAMRFLLEAFRKHRRRLQLEQIILLTVRCLILALLGIALARPILEAAGLIDRGGARYVYLVIDDGMASAVADQESRTALDRHIRQSIDLVNTLGPGDAVGLITAARPARALLAPPSTDHRAIIELLRSLKPKESPTDFPGAFAFVRGAVDEAKQTRQQTLVYLFSDFRGGSATLDSPLPSTHADASGSSTLLAVAPAMQPAANVQIVSIDPVRSVILPESNDGSGQITVRLRRSGGQLSGDASRVRLVGEGLPAVETQTVQWQPGQSEAHVEFTLNLGGKPAADHQLGLTAVIDDDALPADNQRHTILEVHGQVRVLLIDRRAFGFERTLDRLSAGQWIRRALEPVSKSPLQVVEVEPAALDLADVRSADVAIVPRPDLLSDSGWSTLHEFVQRDGLLILMPPAEVNVHQWTEHLAREMHLPWRSMLEVQEHPGGIALAEDQPASELLRMISGEFPVLLPAVQVKRTLPLDPETLASGLAQPLLVLSDGSPLIVTGSPGDDAAASQSSANAAGRSTHGLVIYMTVAPEDPWTTLQLKPLMVPLFQEMIRQGMSVIRSAQRITTGEQTSVARAPAARDLQTPQGERIAIDATGKPQQALQQSGIYTALDQAGQPISKIAVNVDPSAGVTDVQSAAAVSSWLGGSGPWKTFDPQTIGASLGSTAGGSPISGLLLAIVMALVVLETVLARWFSHAYRSEDVGLTSERRPLAPSTGGAA